MRSFESKKQLKPFVARLRPPFHPPDFVFFSTWKRNRPTSFSTIRSAIFQGKSNQNFHKTRPNATPVSDSSGSAFHFHIRLLAQNRLPRASPGFSPDYAPEKALVYHFVKNQADYPFDFFTSFSPAGSLHRILRPISSFPIFRFPSFVRVSFPNLLIFHNYKYLAIQGILANFIFAPGRKI